MTTVLIVDDSKLARIVLGKAIAALQPDWVRLEAGTAAEALELLQHRRVDLVVIDFNMPGKNGLDLGEELRARYPAMPIALATANVQDEVVARARACEVSFVVKPITPEAIRGFIAGAAQKLGTAGA